MPNTEQLHKRTETILQKNFKKKTIKSVHKVEIDFFNHKFCTNGLQNVHKNGLTTATKKNNNNKTPTIKQNSVERCDV